MNILIVGSALFDAIISLENNQHLTLENGKATFSLGDKVPVDIKAFSIGGNATNVASSLTKLEVQNALYTYLGRDALSEFVSHQLEKEGLNAYIETTDAKNGPLSLIFDFEEDRTIFSHHPECMHGFDYDKIPQKPDYIFLTSIGMKWENAYEKVLAYAASQNAPIAFSPGSQQMKNMNETFIKTIHQAKILLCNMEEAKLINKTLTNTIIDDPKELLLNIKNNGFDVLSITDGKNGAYAVDDKNVVYKMESIEPKGHEKTGAGDSYAGAFMAAYSKGMNIPECMKWGVINAVGVMEKIGAHTGQLTLSEMTERSRAVTLEAITL